MDRPPKKYVCEKCGYRGDTPEHEGCNYLAWTTGEHLYIDQLERELALLKASPASAPEGYALIPVEPTSEMTFIGQSHRYDATWSVGAIYREMLAAAPTPPVSDDRKDAEKLLKGLRNLCGFVEDGSSACVTISQDDATKDWIVTVGGPGSKRWWCGRSLEEAIDAAMKEDKP